MKLVLASLLISTFATASLAASNGVPPISSAGGLHVGPTVVLISKPDCLTFGGKVVSIFATICPSGQACETTDIHNDKHQVCVDKA
jgi:hypothetical protein